MLSCSIHPEIHHGFVIPRAQYPATVPSTALLDWYILGVPAVRREVLPGDQLTDPRNPADRRQKLLHKYHKHIQA